MLSRIIMYMVVVAAGATNAHPPHGLRWTSCSCQSPKLVHPFFVSNSLLNRQPERGQTTGTRRTATCSTDTERHLPWIRHVRKQHRYDPRHLRETNTSLTIDTSSRGQKKRLRRPATGAAPTSQCHRNRNPFPGVQTYDFIVAIGAICVNRNSKKKTQIIPCRTTILRVDCGCAGGNPPPEPGGALPAGISRRGKEALTLHETSFFRFRYRSS